MAKTKGRTVGTYLQKSKDPMIDIVRTEAQREGWIKGGGFKLPDDQEKRSISQLADMAGVSDTTLRSWFGGKTRRPQSFTLRLTLEALGVKTRLQRANGTYIKGY